MFQPSTPSKMPQGNKGLINHISNMVAPQVSGFGNDDNSTWKIVKSKRQMKEDRKWKKDNSFPPLPVLSSAVKNENGSDDESKKSSSTKSFTTPIKKPSIKIRRVTPESKKVKIVQVKSEQTDQDEDDKSTNSYSSYEGYFSSSSNDSSKATDKSAKEPSFKIKRKQDRINKKKQEDMELDKIIKRIEGEHITMIQASPKQQEHRTDLKIKQESDEDFFEVAYSAKSVQDMNKNGDNLRQSNLQNEQQGIDTKDLTDNISQENLMKIKQEIDMLHEINMNKDSVNFYLKQEDTFNEDTIMIEIAMDMSHIKDKTDYTKHIKEKLPRLHDQTLPASLREIAFLGPMLCPSITDWTVDGLERGLELEQIEKSMFFQQLKEHGMVQSFKKLYEELHIVWDEYGIPYNKRKKLLLVEIEMISLLLCDVLPCNYSEQGIWVGDQSQGSYYNFFKDKNVDSGHKKWYDLLGSTTYKWFWDVYTNAINLSTLNDEEIVTMDDIFRIVTFIHP